MSEHEHVYAMKRCRICGAAQVMPEVDDDFAATQAFIQRLRDSGSPTVRE